MRATMRITWLLFSLCCICSNTDSQTASDVTKTGVTVTPAPTSGNLTGAQATTASKTVVFLVGTTGASPTGPIGGTSNNGVTTQAPTTTKPTIVASTLSATVATTPNATDKPTPTQPQAPAVTKSPAAPPTTISGALTTVRNDSTPTTTTTSLPVTTPPAATAGSIVLSSRAATTTPKTSAASVPSQLSGTVAPVPPSNSVGTTKTPKVTTYASTTGQQSLTHTTSTTNTSKDSKAVEVTATNVTVISQVQTTKSTDPAGNTGTISTPSTSTKAGAQAAVTSGTKAGTTSLKTTTTTTTIITTSTAGQPKTFLYSLNMGHEEKEEKDLVEVCRRLMVNLQDGNCTLTWQHHNGKIQFDCVEINGKVKTNIATQYYEEITKKPTDNKTLIAILASCGALLIMIVILAVCASHHRKPFNENQQHLTEELHTVENGYHDNPTLEVMEVQPEMQEKKMALNGEFNDSWIVPIDNLLKEDIADEEDTHL